jgi:hypothetical protein
MRQTRVKKPKGKANTWKLGVAIRAHGIAEQGDCEHPVNRASGPLAAHPIAGLKVATCDKLKGRRAHFVAPIAFSEMV